MTGKNHKPVQVITSRMRQISNERQKEQPVRILGLSTSLANAKDLGEWIGASAQHLFNFPAGMSYLPLMTLLNLGDPVNMLSIYIFAANVPRNLNAADSI